MADIRIGISGWRYEPWRKVFYPPDLPQRAELEFAARHFPSIELNGTFYSLQRPEFFARWYAETPPGFVFALKGGRFITHMKKLRDIDTALANFFASGVLALEDQIGPVLWQFPEHMPADLERFADFFAKLPRDTRAAAALASRHDSRVEGRSLTRSRQLRALRHAVEIRNPALATPEFIALLRREDIALVIADTAGRWPYAEDITSDFVYIRLHGDKALYQSGYSDAATRRWAERIQLWRAGGEPADARRIDSATRAAERPRDVFVYFDNDIKVHAPFDALRLQRAVGLGTFQPDAPLAGRRRPGKLHVREAPRTNGFMQRRGAR
ncbi:MAG TPA: DUF72 domain-containing protein [Polyangiales bacterium]|nr:DUF72 domain-containing protein [Polyangiales bacterium]